MSSEPIPSPRATRTRAALIGAGFELLVERPIDAIPIDDFVAKAGVAKGSFFNHFADKQDFAEAIANEVRLEVESLVTRTNAGIADPVERIAGGMCVAASFALAQPKRTAVLLRSQGSSTALAHPLNRGLVADIEAAAAQGLIRPEAASSGALYWLGLCQILMVNLLERRSCADDARQRVGDMIILGLTGLGVALQEATALAARASHRIGQG
ncbi:MAG: TetR/AcrR family transcriptional regulator [Sphingorhabdus sp.]